MSLITSIVFAALALQGSAIPLTRRALSCPGANGSTYTSGSSSYTIECGTDRLLGDMPAPNGMHADTMEDCISQCQARAGCVLVDYVPGPKACYTKSSVGTTIANNNVIGAILSTPTAASTSTTPIAEVAAQVSSVTSGLIGASAGKRGLCYNDAAVTKLFGGSGSKVTWAYDWSQSSNSGFNSGLMYIPMLWSGSSDRASTWTVKANAAIAAGADTLLGFNEPDHAQQANMDVGSAVSAWKNLMQPFAGRVQLAAPAVTNGGSPMGLTYLKSFLSSCTGCTIDVCPIHWYDSATNIQYFKNYIADAHTACNNKPIWITEFGASGSVDQVSTFMKTVLPWLDSLDYVQRYSYFMAAPSSDGSMLVNGASNGLSTIGQLYNTL